MKIIRRHDLSSQTFWEIDVNGHIHRWFVYPYVPLTIYFNSTISGYERSIPIALYLNENDIESSIEKYNMYLMLK